MAASKPKTVSTKRLAQLLEEQQESFALDVYISERSYVKKSSSSDGNGHKISANNFNRSQSDKVKRRIGIPNGSRILRLAINKLISYKTCQKVKHCINKAQKDKGNQASRPTNMHQHTAVSNWLSSSSSSNKAVLRSSSEEVPTNKKVQWGYMEDNKQNSPISVLEELPPYEDDHFLGANGEGTTSISSLNLPRKDKEDTKLSTYLCKLLLRSVCEEQNHVSKSELEEVRSDLAQDLKPRQISMQKKQHHLFDSMNEVVDTHGRHGRKQRSIREITGQQICSWGNQCGDIKNINQQIDLDFSGTIVEWRNIQLLNKDISLEIADVILDNIVVETIHSEIYDY